MIRRTLLLALAGSLGACMSSEPVALEYYRLAPRQRASVAPVNDNLPAVVLERVTLAGYLEQSGLVLQRGPNQLQVSRTHVWAQGLDVAIPEALLAALRDTSTDYRYFLRGSDFVPRVDYAVRLHVDAFHATSDGDVIATGRYQLVDVNAEQELVNRQFDLREDLRADGYPQAVEQLGELVRQLAGTLVEDLAARDR